MNTKIKNQSKSVNLFLRFCYNFPFDIKDRFAEYYGKSLGEHFYRKFLGYTKDLPNSFYGMIRMYSEMTDNNREIFIKLINDYYKSIEK